MEHVEITDEARVRAPVLLYAFTGWNDAGEAASTALRTVGRQWKARRLGRIDPEAFTDFATVRPTVYLDGGRRKIRWPATQLWSVSLPGADAIIALGPEPALRWRLFSDQLVALADHFGASMTLSLGALLADVPHTRAVHVIGTATDDETIARYGLRRSTYEGPTGIVGVLAERLATAGHATASLWAAVPGYTSQLPSPLAAEALFDKTCAMLGTPAPGGLFSTAVAEYRAKLDAMVAESHELAAYLARLETLVDDDAPSVAGAIDEAAAGEATTTGLVEEVERFLRDGQEREPGGEDDT